MQHHSPQAAPPRGIDHLVIGVRDLDRAGAFYERLGFRVGARNRHPWGTENRIVQFPGAFLEIIAVGDAGAIPPHAPGRFSFGAFVRDALESGEGMSMLVLESRDARADAVSFRAEGIGDFEPFFFERQAKRPDGSTVRVAFSLAFADNPAAPDCGFFVCQQHEPQNFWNPAFQRHANGATGLAAAVLAAPQPQAQQGFLSRFGGVNPAPVDGGLRFDLARGRIDVLTPQAAAARLGADGRETAHFAGFAVSVLDPEAVRIMIEAAGIACRPTESGIVVPASEAAGCAIAFEKG